MESKVLIGVIAAVASAIVAWHSAKTKFKLQELEYEIRLKDQYLGNARDYLCEIYIPLSIAISSLNAAYQRYRVNQAGKHLEDELVAEILEFLKNYQVLCKRGGNAFLTADLDESLSSFVIFLSSSAHAEVVDVQDVLEVNMPAIAPFAFDSPLRTEFRSSKQSRLGNFRLSTLGIDLVIREQEVMSAPVSSQEFERRFLRDTFRVNRLVKEVTLGSNGIG